MEKFSLIILLFLLFSCGTRKVETEKKEQDSTKISVINSTIESEKTIFATNYTYTPFDGLKPMIIDGKKFENAIVFGGTKNEKIKTKNVIKKYFIKKTITIEKLKETQKTDYTILWSLIVFILCGFIFLWFKTDI